MGRTYIHKYNTRGGQYGTGMGITVLPAVPNTTYESCYTCKHCYQRRCGKTSLSIADLGKFTAKYCKYYDYSGGAKYRTISRPRQKAEEQAAEKQSKKDSQKKSAESQSSRKKKKSDRTEKTASSAKKKNNLTMAEKAVSSKPEKKKKKARKLKPEKKSLPIPVVGMKVNHTTYGIGSIRMVEGTKVRVLFNEQEPCRHMDWNFMVEKKIIQIVQ